jgi:hypothetical protein
VRKATSQQGAVEGRGVHGAAGRLFAARAPEPRSLIGVVARGAAEPVGMLNSFVRCSSRGVAPVLRGCTDLDSGFGVMSLFSASPAHRSRRGDMSRAHAQTEGAREGRRETQSEPERERERETERDTEMRAGKPRI